MDGNDFLNNACRGVGNYELCGVAKRGMDCRIRDVLIERVRPVDTPLALVVDADLAAACQCGFARVHDRARTHQCSPRTGGLPLTEFTGGIHDDFDPSGVDAEFLHRHLQRDRMDALAHLGPRVADLDTVVLVESHDRFRNLFEAVPEAGVLQPEPEPNGLTSGDRRVEVGLDGVEANVGSVASVVHDLAGSPNLAGMDYVAFAHLPSADPDHLGEAVDGALHGKLRLVRAESPKRSAHGIVRSDSNRVDVDCRQVVRPTRVPGSPFEHLHADARVWAGITDHPCT